MPLVVFEGLDGSGKSTLINGLSAELKRTGRPFVLTREPGGTPLGEEIRELLLRVVGDAPVPKAELLLYEAIRRQHVEKVIKPALARREWVLCDRFTASSLAFQCGGRGLPEAEVQWLNHFATGGLVPDLWVLLDLTVEESRKRREGRERKRGQKLDRFELEQEDFHERVRQHYLQQAERDRARWLVLPADLTPAALLSHLLQQMAERKWLGC